MLQCFHVTRGFMASVVAFSVRLGISTSVIAGVSPPDLAHGWQRVQMGPGSWASEEVATLISSHHGILVAVGHGLYEAGSARPIVWRSTDGRAWREVSPGIKVNRVVPWHQGFIAIGRTIVCNDIYPGRQTACDGAAALPTHAYPLAAVTADGVTWQRSRAVRPRGIGELLDIAANQGTLISVDGNRLWHSRDGLTWQRVTMARRQFPSGSHVENIVKWMSGFVVTGFVGSTPSSTSGLATIWLSSDGTHWQRVWEDHSASAGQDAIHGILEGRHRLVAWGPADVNQPSSGSVLWTSTDGKAWHRLLPAAFRTAWITQIAASRFGYLAVLGYPAGLWLSQDALHWTAVTSDASFVGYPAAQSGSTSPFPSATYGLAATSAGLVVVGSAGSGTFSGPSSIATAWTWSPRASYVAAGALEKM